MPNQPSVHHCFISPLYHVVHWRFLATAFQSRFLLPKLCWGTGGLGDGLWHCFPCFTNIKVLEQPSVYGFPHILIKPPLPLLKALCASSRSVKLPAPKNVMRKTCQNVKIQRPNCQTWRKWWLNNVKQMNIYQMITSSVLRMFITREGLETYPVLRSSSGHRLVM